MSEWYSDLPVLGKVYLWLAVVATVFLVIQIIMLMFSSFGGDADFDGDGDIDVDTDPGVSLFTAKTITAFFAVGCWAGLLVVSLTEGGLQWVSIPVALVSGGIAMIFVAFMIRAILRLQCNGAVDYDKFAGKTATVYVSIPPARSGRGKITLNAQGRYMEIDAVTEESGKIPCDLIVEIVAVENECAVVKRAEKTAADGEKISDIAS